MNIIQIIGLPASGKTTYIKEYLNLNLNVKYLDVANYPHQNRIKKLYKDIKKLYTDSNKSLIIESACGFNIKNSKIIKLKINYDEVCMNFLKRENYLDKDYLSLLDNQLKIPDYTVSNKDALYCILNKLFYRDI